MVEFVDGIVSEIKIDYVVLFVMDDDENMMKKFGILMGFILIKVRFCGLLCFL